MRLGVRICVAIPPIFIFNSARRWHHLPVRSIEASMIPETRYAKSGEVNSAYPVVGEGPVDLVFVPGWVSQVEHAWEEPSFAPFLHRMTKFSRLVLIDRRGTGLCNNTGGEPMAEYLLIESRDPFDSADTANYYELAADLARDGNQVVLFLVQNGVLPARRGARNQALTALADAGVRVLAEDFSLRERGIEPDRVVAGVDPAPLSTVIDALAGGAKAMWH
jgi:hypothetical protein